MKPEEAPRTVTADWDAPWVAPAREVLDAATSEREEDEVKDWLIERSSDILTRTVNAIRGEPGPLEGHGWQSLPEEAAALKAERDRLTRQLAAVREALDSAGWRSYAADSDANEFRLCRYCSADHAGNSALPNWRDLRSHSGDCPFTAAQIEIR